MITDCKTRAGDTAEQSSDESATGKPRYLL
jgi:hypothetical protein